MIAQLHAQLPFELAVPEGEEFLLETYQVNEYAIQVGVPQRSDSAKTRPEDEQITINGKQIYFADVLAIRFYKDSFSRGAGSEIDPPYSVINFAIERHLERLKYVTQAAAIKSVEVPRCSWEMRYLEDDGSELKEEEGKLRFRGSRAFELRWIWCDAHVWADVLSLPEEFNPPQWRTLLTDAKGVLPHVGASLVLTFTSLEVFISETLASLQSKNTVPGELWQWINNRKNKLNNPSVEEGFSALLKMCCGHSLKEDKELWECFKNLQTARNRFVHEGEARVGGKVVDSDRALQFIGAAERITEVIREWLPEDVRWPTFQRKVELRFSKKIT